MAAILHDIIIYFKKIKMNFFDFHKKNKLVAQNNEIKKMLRDKKGSRLSDKINKPQPSRIRMELAALRNFVMDAKDPYNPSWVQLYKTYENALTDGEVFCQKGIAESKLKAEPFIIIKGQKENKELAEYFKKPWFDSFCEAKISAEFFGYRLLEFGPFNEDGQFTGCKLFPLYNVYPHNKNIILSETDTEGIPYFNDDKEKGPVLRPADLFFIELGDSERLGKLQLITREVILKSFARHDWSEHSEKWGQPRMVVKTDAEGNDLNIIEYGLRNFARNGYAIVGIDDEIEKIEASSNGSGYLVYDKNIDKCDKYISKIINGQSGTGEEKAFVGSAEVSERILSDFMKSRLRETENIINERLIPFLIQWGYPLDGARFHYPALDPPTPGEKNTNDPAAQNKFSVLKKKDKNRHTMAVDAKKNEIKDILSSYSKQIKMGTQVDIAKTSYNNPRFSLYSNLQSDAARFATFRNSQKQRDLLKATGVSEKKDIEKLYKDYLKTENQTIFGNSAAAERWTGFKENADMYPNLQWRTAGDNDVRPEHAALEGLTLPIDDPFWNSHTPPLGWGCRCELVQTDKEIKKPEYYKETPVPKGFEFNPGITQTLFSDTAGYYTSPSAEKTKSLTKEAINLAGQVSKEEVTAALADKELTIKSPGIEEAKITTADIKRITTGEHSNPVLRNYLLFDIKNAAKNATLVNTTTTKGIVNYTYKIKGIKNMYLKFNKTVTGKIKLQAITDNI